MQGSMRRACTYSHINDAPRRAKNLDKSLRGRFDTFDHASPIERARFSPAASSLTAKKKAFSERSNFSREKHSKIKRWENGTRIDSALRVASMFEPRPTGEESLSRRDNV